MGRRLADGAIASGVVLAIIGLVGAVVVDFSFDRPKHPQPLSYAVSFRGPGSSCGDTSTLYVDSTTGEELQCRSGGFPAPYTGRLSSGEENEVLNQCRSLAGDGTLDGADQKAVHQLLDQISARHPVGAPVAGDPVGNRLNDAAAIVLAVGVGLVLIGLGTRAVLHWRKPPMVRISRVGRRKRATAGAPPRGRRRQDGSAADRRKRDDTVD